MSSVTISKDEYTNLKIRSKAYERMLIAVQGDFSLAPTEKSKKKIMSGFKSTGKYNKKFLDALEKGISRSTYFSA